MEPFIISTESTSDLTPELIRECDVRVIQMNYTLDGVEYPTEDGKTLTAEEFYDRVRKGGMPKTSMVNEDGATRWLTELSKEGKKILHLSFSSGLSGTYQSFAKAAENLNQQLGEERVVVIDTLAASMGQGLLVWYAAQYRKAGDDFETVCRKMEVLCPKLNHYFTVDSLIHLRRGGRVSSFSALIGTILNIKPELHVDEKGKLIPIGKVPGRKKAISGLFAKMKERWIPEENKTVFISHGDCLDEAKSLGKMIEEELGVKDIRYGMIGPVIGAHSGPGTIALFFVAQNRFEKK